MDRKTLALFLFVPTVALAAPPPGIPDGWSDGYHIDGAGHNLHHDELEVAVAVTTEFFSN